MMRTMILVLMMVIFAFANGVADAQIVLAPQEAARSVQIQDLKATLPVISGVVINKTPHIVRDIELLIEYHWLWANEFKPGPESPGRVVTLKLDKELKPGQSTAFNYAPDPPLSARKDGQYDPEVTVASFTTVILDATAAR